MSPSTQASAESTLRRGMARGLQRPWLLVVPGLTMLATLLSLALTGAAAGTQLNDPGPFTRWALPLMEGIHHVSMAATIGSLVFVCFFLPRYAADADGNRRRGRAGRAGAAVEQEYGPFSAALNFGAVASLTWTLSAVAVLVLTYAEISGAGVSADQTYTAQLLSYVQNIASGQHQACVVVVAAVVTTLVFGLRSLLGLLVTLGLSLVALVALALDGHSSGGQDHMGAVNSLGLHLLGVSLWFGGLAVLAWLSRDLSGKDAGTGTVPERHRGHSTAAHRRVPMAVAVLHRYSSVALFSFVLVAASGVVNAAVRVHGWADLGTSYGALVLAKASLTVLLGVAGAMHRTWLMPRVASGHFSAFRGIWQVVLGELVIMSGATGLAVTLSRSAPPVSEKLDADASPARILTWYDMPPEPHLASWFTTWRWDWFWVAIALVGAWAYLWAFWELRRRGGRWNPLRLLSWLLGLALLTCATSGSLTVYARVLFSVHMVEHMSLTMIIPLFLVLGAPVTLLLKALEPRQDGTRGVREWILRITHSTWARVVTNPIFAAVMFAGSIVMFYFTPLFGITLKYHVGHEFMMVHFLMTGYLFALVLVGIDPVPRRPAYPLRLITLIATLGYHAFVGIALMGSTALLQAWWFGNLGRDWGTRDAIADQQLGGSIMWGLGEIPTMVIAVIVGVQWSIADGRLAKRLDRQADRDGDADLVAYNEMLEQLNEGGQRTPGS